MKCMVCCGLQIRGADSTAYVAAGASGYIACEPESFVVLTPQPCPPSDQLYLGIMGVESRPTNQEIVFGRLEVEVDAHRIVFDPLELSPACF